jgi:hypothetical protein
MKRLGAGGKVFIAKLFLLREQIKLTEPMQECNKKFVAQLYNVLI